MKEFVIFAVLRDGIVVNHMNKDPHKPVFEYSIYDLTCSPLFTFPIGDDKQQFDDIIQLQEAFPNRVTVFCKNVQKKVFEHFNTSTENVLVNTYFPLHKSIIGQTIDFEQIFISEKSLYRSMCIDLEEPFHKVIIHVRYAQKTDTNAVTLTFEEIDAFCKTAFANIPIMAISYCDTLCPTLRSYFEKILICT